MGIFHHFAVILAHPSTGTRMIGAMLHSHPQVVRLFEPHRPSEERWIKDVLEPLEADRIDRGRDIGVFDVKWPMHWKKFMTSWILLWKWPVIRLTRENLDELTASEFARTIAQNRVELLPVEVTWKAYRERRQQVTGALLGLDSYIEFLEHSGARVLRVTYEEMAGYDGLDAAEMAEPAMMRITSFLGLRPARLTSHVRKTRGRFEDKVRIVDRPVGGTA